MSGEYYKQRNGQPVFIRFDGFQSFYNIGWFIQVFYNIGLCFSKGDMMICPGCGEAIADDLNFCPSCGMELDSLNCPSCGAKNNKKSKYCRACGKSLNYANTIDYSNGKIDNGEGGTEGPFKGESRTEKGIQGPFEGDSRSSDVMKGPFDD